MQSGDRQGGNPEENDVETARGGHLQGDQDEADDQPVPPEHVGRQL
jgi:hypothetical protein